MEPRTCAQSPILCELCEKSKNAPHYCRVCGESMCEECKGIHNRGKATKDHEVVLRGTNQSKNDPRACIKHPGQIYNFCCDQCIEPVCIDCIMEYHSEHKFRKLTEAIENAKATLSDELDAMEKKTLPELQAAIEDLEKQTINYNEKIKDIEKQLQTETEMMSKVTNIYNDMEKELSEKHENDQKTFQSSKQILSGQLEKVTKNMELYCEKRDNIDLIKFIKSRPNPDNTMVIPELAKVQLPSYITGTINNESIDEKMGRLVTWQNGRKVTFRPDKKYGRKFYF